MNLGKQKKPSDSHKLRASGVYLIHNYPSVNASEVYQEGTQNNGAVLHNLAISGAPTTPHLIHPYIE